MVKLHSLSKHNLNDVPEHIFEEICELNNSIIAALAPIIIKKDPNIVLASMGRVYAAFIYQFISDDPKEKTKAAEMYARLLIDTIKQLEKNAQKSQLPLPKGRGLS